MVARANGPFCPVAEPGPVGRLSSRTVAQLGTAEQLVLWALRQRLQDGAAASPVLLHGFRLAFGFGLVDYPGHAAVSVNTCLSMLDFKVSIGKRPSAEWRFAASGCRLERP